NESYLQILDALLDNLAIVNNNVNGYNANARLRGRHRTVPFDIDLREIEPMKKAVSRLLICGLLFGLALPLLGSSSSYARAWSVSSGSGLPYSAELRITGPAGGVVRTLVVDPEEPIRFFFGYMLCQLFAIMD